MAEARVLGRGEVARDHREGSRAHGAVGRLV